MLSNLPSKIHELASPSRCIRFQVPLGYRCEQMTNTLLALSCTYPSMTPTASDGADRDKAVLVFISLSDGPSRAEQLESLAALEPRHERSCKHFYAGQHGPISLYRRSDTQDAFFHVFRANDGARVCVEDAGNWSSIYAVYRKLGPALCVHYEISKTVGDSFMLFDGVVSEFLRELRVDDD